MSSPQGWYQDPGGPGLRWYDGERWTEHVAPPAPRPPGGPGGKATATPDGRPLAGWGRRLAAYTLDGLVVTSITAVLGVPWLRRVVDAYRDYWDETVEAVDAGRSMPPGQSLELYGDLLGPAVALALISCVVGLAYHVGAWRWRSASLGMLALGIRVRTWEQPEGPGLGWRPALVRWASFYGVGLLGIVPVVGSVTGVYVILAGLWPLWDARRQGLHDKAAGTVVVRVA